MVEWVLNAPTAPLIPERMPLNLALVLDRSGSMSGEKLRYVQQAADYVLEQLNERDRAAVVAYDNEIDMVAASEAMARNHREAVKRRIQALRSGNTTNLGEGWLRGAAQVADCQLTNGDNCVLLFTDGLANRGITDPEELAHHAHEVRLRRVSTSTFGVGLDFNEHLLEAIAEKGGGPFYF